MDAGRGRRRKGGGEQGRAGRVTNREEREWKEARHSIWLLTHGAGTDANAGVAPDRLSRSQAGGAADLADLMPNAGGLGGGGGGGGGAGEEGTGMGDVSMDAPVRTFAQWSERAAAADDDQNTRKNTRKIGVCIVPPEDVWGPIQVLQCARACAYACVRVRARVRVVCVRARA